MAGDRRQLVGRIAAGVAALAWAGNAGVGLVVTWLHGRMASLPWEQLTWPVLVALAHAPLAIVLEAQRRTIARWVPLWGACMVLVPPILTFALVWVPGISSRYASPAPGPDAAVKGPHVVLLTLDSFRADHLGALSGGPFTPELDKLAAESLHYTQAVTTAPLSGPAHASMLTGKGVLEHGLTMNGAAIKSPTVVERIREKGYRTGAFVSAQVLDRDSGLHPGFNHYDDRWGAVQRMNWLPAVADLGVEGRPPRRPGNETVDRALDWLGSDDDPAFLWVHLYDAHGPYAPPEKFQPPMETLEQARRMDRDAMRRAADVSRIGDRPRSRVREQTILYSASIRWVDALAGRLVGKLPPDTILIVVGDHGESLGEHDYFFSHGATVWENVVHVPLLVRWPDRFGKGSRFDGLTSVASIHRLLEEATGLAAPSPPAAEGSVFVYTTGQDGRTVDTTETATRHPPAACVRRDGAKVARTGKEAAAYYALRDDPGELSPLPVPPELARDVDLLEAVLSKPLPRLDDAQRARLEALGYRE